MENVGIRYLKAAEIYKDNLLAQEIVQIIEGEANFYVRIFLTLIFECTKDIR